MATPAWVAKLVPEGSVPDSVLERSRRREIRYLCFRLQQENDPEEPDAPPAEDVPRGFKVVFSKQELFDGWVNFGRTWDVGNPESPGPPLDDPALEGLVWDDYLVVVPRFLTIHEENEDENTAAMRRNEIQARMRRRGLEGHVQSGN